jgi:Flp pilus assembly protein TadG
MIMIGRHKNRRGGALMETAITLPLAATLLTGIAEYGMTTMLEMQLTSATQAGLEFALRGGDADGTRRVVRDALHDTTGDVTVNLSTQCECALVTVTCGVPCPDGTPQRRLVTVSSSRNYIALTTSLGRAEPKTTLNASATGRVR